MMIDYTPPDYHGDAISMLYHEHSEKGTLAPLDGNKPSDSPQQGQWQGDPAKTRQAMTSSNPGFCVAHLYRWSS